MSFEQSLTVGKVGESAIAGYFLNKNYSVLPVYENTDQYKGPTVYTSNGQIISPDMIVFKPGSMYWIEAKHKEAFTWHRISQKWTTGIDKHHFDEYCRLIDKVDFPIWLMFLHKDGRAKNTPEGKTSPTGLFGNELSFLAKNINHRSPKWANGMVYWNYIPEDKENSQLKKIANYNLCLE